MLTTQQWLPIDSHSLCTFISDFMIHINFGIASIWILLRIELTILHCFALCICVYVCCLLCHQISRIKVEKFESVIVVRTSLSLSDMPRFCALTPFKANRVKRLNLPPHYHLFNKYPLFIGVQKCTFTHIKGCSLRMNQNMGNSENILPIA